VGQEKFSSENNPVTDWNQVRETILMIDTVVTQLGWTLRDGDSSVDTLTHSFTLMLNSASEILQLASQLDEGELKEKIVAKANLIFGQMQADIVAFQFYDKMSQRLNHASGSLEQMAELIGAPEKRHSLDEWQRLQNTIRARYTTEADRVMFDAVLGGASLEEAIDVFREYESQTVEDDLELF